MPSEGTDEPAAPRRTRRDVLRLGAAAAAAAAAGGPQLATRALADPAPLGIARDIPHRTIRELMEAGKLPGLSAAVFRGRRLLWSRGYGLAHIGRDEPVTPNTIFMLASISKTFIATAVMQAVEDGLFALDDPVNDLLPFDVEIPGHEDVAITVRHLLLHTSAIADRWSVWNDLYADGDSPIALGDFLAGYLVPGGEDYRARNFYDTPPGARYRYSNIASALAAYVVEAVSGMGFDAWCEDRIFGPLGMRRTGWHLADVPRRDVAMPYRWAAARDRYEAFGQYGYPDYPDGALRTSAPQLARHFGMILAEGRYDGERVLDARSVRRLLRPQVPGIAWGQGLIWYRWRRAGRTLIGHTGSDRGVATIAFFDASSEVGVVALANGNWRRAGGRYPLQRIAYLLLEAADPRRGPRLADAEDEPGPPIIRR